MTNITSILTYDISWRRDSTKECKDEEFIKTFLQFRDSGSPSYVGDAVELYKNGRYKMYLESMLLAKFTDEECVEYFGCDVKAIEMYKKMFFDIDPVINSRARLIEIAQSGLPNEVNLKMCAVKFGRGFIRFYTGIDNELSSECSEKLRSRLNDGVVIKSLGHEFTGSSSEDMALYMRMISSINKEKKVDAKEGLKKIVDHFSSFFHED